MTNLYLNNINNDTNLNNRVVAQGSLLREYNIYQLIYKAL